MNIKLTGTTATRLWLLACAFVLVSAVHAFATGPWVEEIWTMMSFEKNTYPASNFDPYFAQLKVIRDGVANHDQQSVRTETDRFLKMLSTREHGINDVAADEIYNFVLAVKPADADTATSGLELGIENQMPMSVPDHTLQKPYEGGPPCKIQGCDYWIDDVYDPGAAG
ncbi:MAG: hypothetical protein NTNFB02_08110 [Nitrospira sp.]